MTRPNERLLSYRWSATGSRTRQKQSRAWMCSRPFSSGRPEDLVTPSPDFSRPRASGSVSRRGAEHDAAALPDRSDEFGDLPARPGRRRSGEPRELGGRGLEHLGRIDAVVNLGASRRAEPLRLHAANIDANGRDQRERANLHHLGHSCRSWKQAGGGSSSTSAAPWNGRVALLSS